MSCIDPCIAYTQKKSKLKVAIYSYKLHSQFCSILMSYLVIYREKIMVLYDT